MRIEVSLPDLPARQAWDQLGSWSARLDRELGELTVVEQQHHAVSPAVRQAFLCAQPCDVSPLLSIYPELRALCWGGSLAGALGHASTLGKGRVYALGGRAYSFQQRDALRAEQRLLPLHEVALEVAARSAVEESGHSPLWISLGLDVLAPFLLPELAAPAAGGASLETLRASLEAVPGERVVGFEVTGYRPIEKRIPVTALTAAELLRDNILVWWGTNR